MMLNVFVFICQVYVFFDKMSVFLLVTEKLINVLEFDFSLVTLLGGIGICTHNIITTYTHY